MNNLTKKNQNKSQSSRSNKSMLNDENENKKSIFKKD